MELYVHFKANPLKEIGVFCCTFSFAALCRSFDFVKSGVQLLKCSIKTALCPVIFSCIYNETQSSKTISRTIQNLLSGSILLLPFSS